MYKIFLTTAFVGISGILFAQSDSAAFYLQKGLEELEQL